MLQRLKSLLGGDDGAAELARHAADTGDTDELRLAVAALMLEAATLDDFDEAERERIIVLLRERFELNDEQAHDLLEEARTHVGSQEQIHPFVRVLNDRLDEAERTQVAQMLWEVIYADGDAHHFEANLMRRLAGLIHIGDRAMGDARKRAMARLGIED